MLEYNFSAETLKPPPSCREEIIGLLLVKELIIVDKGSGVRAGDIRLRGLPYLKVPYRHITQERLVGSNLRISFRSHCVHFGWTSKDPQTYSACLIDM